MIEVWKQCPLCREQHYIELSNEQCRKLYEYEQGDGLIQEKFSELGRVEREFLKTGYCKKCQAEIFGDGESELII